VASGFLRLTDDAWQWGGDPETIEETITNGRQANMPARGLNPNLSNEQLGYIVEHILALNGRSDDPEAAERGEELYQNACATCHSPEGKGNKGMGAPNLTNDTWLYGGDRQTLMETLTLGRGGHMPAQTRFRTTRSTSWPPTSIAFPGNIERRNSNQQKEG